MVKRIFFTLLTVLFLYYQYTNGQPEARIPGSGFLYSEIHAVESGSSFVLYYTYRIPYDRFVFIKDGNKYSTKFRISIEVTDTLSNHVTRQIKEENIFADNYEETNSNKIYFEGIIKFNLHEGIYKLMPEVTDLNSNRDIKLHDRRVNLDGYLKKNFLHPIVVQHDKLDCKGKLNFELTNFDSSIPFSEEDYSLIIPSIDTTLGGIYAVIISGEDTVYNKKIEKHYISKIIPDECDGKIIVTEADSLKETENFVLDNFSHDLGAGIARIIISKDNKFKNKQEFNIPVIWIDEPFSLQKPKEAIEYLEDIEERSVVDSLLSFSKDEYPKVLFDFWKQFDPTKGTEFNPLMNEFYLRVDYAIKNFVTLGGKSGADTDRGKIYIKYGKPNEIERSSNQYGKVEEKWVYKNPLRIFLFVDKEGTGDYTLIK